MMAEAMEFPKTFDEFVDSYGFIDTKEVYTNGSQLIPVFRAKQWLEHISEKTQMIDKSNFDEEQYKTDLQSAYDCGYNKALSADGEYIKKKDMERILYSTNNVVRIGELFTELPTYSFPNSAENKGEWINETPHTDGCPIYTCSECGRSNLWESPFCPSCGADMRGET